MRFQNSLVAFAATLSSAVATTIYANTGCILVSNEPLCNSKNSVTINDGVAQIYSSFDGSTGPEQSEAGCGVTITWPDYYGELFWGQDNCPYDATGAQILDDNGESQCCLQGVGGGLVTNPYNSFY